MAVLTPFFDVVAGVAILAGRSSLLDKGVFKTANTNFTVRHLLALGFIGYGGWNLWKIERAQDKLKKTLDAESFKDELDPKLTDEQFMRFFNDESRDNNYLAMNSNLTTEQIDLLYSTEGVDNDYLAQYSKLTDEQFMRFFNDESMNNNYLAMNSNLTDEQFMRLINDKSVDNNYLARDDNLTDEQFMRLINDNSVDNDYLARNPNLTTEQIDLLSFFGAESFGAEDWRTRLNVCRGCGFSDYDDEVVWRIDGMCRNCKSMSGAESFGAEPSYRGSGDLYDCGCAVDDYEDDWNISCESCGYVSCLDCHYVDSTDVNPQNWKCYEGYGCNKGAESFSAEFEDKLCGNCEGDIESGMGFTIPPYYSPHTIWCESCYDYHFEAESFEHDAASCNHPDEVDCMSCGKVLKHMMSG